MTQLNVTDKFYYYSHCGNVITIARDCDADTAYRKAIRKIARVGRRFKMNTGSPKWNMYGETCGSM